MRALAIGLLLLSTGSAVAQETPRALLELAFEPYSSGDYSAEWDALYSEGLKARFAEDIARYAPDEVPTVNFDPLVYSQDIRVTDIVIAEPVVQGDSAIGIVTFNNYDVPGITVVAMVREGEVWRIDDIAIMRGEYRYLLSELLRLGPL